MKFEFFRQIFEKYTNVKFHESSSSGSLIGPCGQTDGLTDGQADMTKLIVAFLNFVNGPENSWRLGLVMPYNTNSKKTTLFNHDGVMICKHTPPPPPRLVHNFV